MAKGFLIGAIWGGVVAIGGAGVLSVMTGPVAEGGFAPGAEAPQGSPAATLGDAAGTPPEDAPEALSLPQDSAPDLSKAEGPAPEPEPAPMDETAIARDDPSSPVVTEEPVETPDPSAASTAAAPSVPDGGTGEDAPDPQAADVPPGLADDPQAARPASDASPDTAEADRPAPEASVDVPEALAAPLPGASPETAQARPAEARPSGAEAAPAPSEPAPEATAAVSAEAAPGVEAGAGQIDLALAPEDEQSPAEALDASPGPVTGVRRAETPAGVPGVAEDRPLPEETRPPGDPAVGAAPDALGTAQPDEVEAPDIASLTPVSPGGQGASPEAPTPDPDPRVSADPGLPPKPAAEPEAEETTREPARLETRAGSLLATREPAVQQNRLPSITPEDPEAPGATPDDAGPEVVDAPADDSPLTRNAAGFEAPAGVPRMAIILIDDGAGPLGPEALESFPFPVTFAIAPGHPAPATAAAAYRALGFEVLAMGAVPAGAVPSDVEVALAGALNAVPQAVGVLEDPSASLQADRGVAAQATDYLLASGHGLVMMPKGLNTAQKLALKEGVPSAALFRDIDAEGQSAGMIRRILDQAAFRARQEGAVVMLGRLRADTVSALVLWGLQDRGSTITLVPISTVLTESLNTAE